GDRLGGAAHVAAAAEVAVGGRIDAFALGHVTIVEPARRALLTAGGGESRARAARAGTSRRDGALLPARGRCRPSRVRPRRTRACHRRRRLAPAASATDPAGGA